MTLHGLILAGGTGSRFAADGETTPKALMPIGSQPQLLRLADTLTRLGCDSVSAMVRAEVLEQLGPAPQGLSAHACRTPSSLHTLVEGLAHVPPGPVFCTLVDTIMPSGDWRRAFAAAQDEVATGAADAMLVVTPFADDDERPLYASVDETGRVTAVGEVPGARRLVTGGVYAFAARTRAMASAALHAGADRLRAFLAALPAHGARVIAVEVARVVDLDRRRDLAAAEAVVEADRG